MLKKAETQLAKDVEAEVINHEYLPVLGMESFAANATKMLLGSESKSLKEGKAIYFYYFLLATPSSVASDIGDWNNSGSFSCSGTLVLPQRCS